jgi:hypothetical protein
MEDQLAYPLYTASEPLHIVPEEVVVTCTNCPIQTDWTELRSVLQEMRDYIQKSFEQILENNKRILKGEVDENDFDDDWDEDYEEEEDDRDPRA